MKLSKVNKINPDKRTYKPAPELILSRRDVGIEIECEGYSGQGEAPQYWTLVSDGSLRNGGIELVSEIIRGEDIINALNSAQTFFSKNKLEFSDRCSVHVHLDVRHLDTEELMFLVSTYLLFEKVFFLECGDPEREHNNHCRPVQSSMELYPLVKKLFSLNERKVAQGLNDWPKYTAFNLKPVLTQGSIEFRHHVGAIDKKVVLKWINLVFSLASYARKNKGKDLQSCIDRVCGDGELLFNEVFPSLEGKFTDEVHTGMIEGARFIQVPVNTRNEEEQEGSSSASRLFGAVSMARRGARIPAQPLREPGLHFDAGVAIDPAIQREPVSMERLQEIRAELDAERAILQDDGV